MTQTDLHVEEWWFRSEGEAAHFVKAAAIGQAVKFPHEFVALSVPTNYDRPYAWECPRNLVVFSEGRDSRLGCSYTTAWLCAPSQDMLLTIAPAVSGKLTIARVMKCPHGNSGPCSECEAQ